MVDRKSNMQLADQTPSLVEEKASGISLTASLDPASILLQGHNTKHSFNLIGFIYPLTSIKSKIIKMII